MGFELSTGTLFIIDDDEIAKLGDGIPFIEEIELSVNENPPRLCHLNDTSACSFEVCGVDLANLNDFCNIPPSNGKFTMECSIPIMIQARWHKKTRIRKKWLKRFGMKPDMVKMRANATAGEYHTDDGSFDFETDIPEYIWRPDQKRKDLKIEF
jgi:hypothetical protein